jgi:hypothetical protein
MNTLQQFNEAKSNNDWTKAQEIIENLSQNPENGENDPENGERGNQIAEYLNNRDKQGKQIKIIS